MVFHNGKYIFNKKYIEFIVDWGDKKMDKSELSLQSLYDLIQQKADTNHTHTFIGSIESALSLQGVSYEYFVR